MGNTYGNVTLRGVDVGRVAEVLDDFERSAYLLPDGDRVAVFMEEADEDPLDAAGNLSVALGCTALGVFVFDSDLLVTWLVVNGEITRPVRVGRAAGRRARGARPGRGRGR